MIEYCTKYTPRYRLRHPGEFMAGQARDSSTNSVIVANSTTY